MRIHAARILTTALLVQSCVEVGSTDLPTTEPIADTPTDTIDSDTLPDPGGDTTDTTEGTVETSDTTEAIPATPDPATGISPSGGAAGPTLTCTGQQVNTYTWPNIPIGIGYYERQTGTVSANGVWADGTPATITVHYNVTQDPVYELWSTPLPGYGPQHCPHRWDIPVHYDWEILGWDSGDVSYYMDPETYGPTEPIGDMISADMWYTIPGTLPEDRPRNIAVTGFWDHTGRFWGRVVANLRADQVLPGGQAGRDMFVWDTNNP
jgi:hypothetical protein